MFEAIQPASPDPILGLTEAFVNDPNPQKINLGVGVYKSAQGVTPVLDCVKEAQQRLNQAETSKSYKPIEGDPTYRALVQQLMFGQNHEVITSQRAATAHTPGGTGALRTAGDYLAYQHPGASIWLSDPTWANHANIFQAAGLTIQTYPYFDKENNCLDFGSMCEALHRIPAGDVILLHGCCHNPTGADPTPEQWAQIAAILKERQVLPLLDFAYQGFGNGLTEDAAGLLALAQPGSEMLICSSFSKNFGLYNERVGALTVVCQTPESAEAVLSHVKTVIRRNYSNPPAHGAAIVSTILADDTLKQQWQQELTDMRHRINTMRQLFVQNMAKRCPQHDFGFITRQKGMFSFSGLTRSQVQTLKEQYAVYIVGSGRINVAGMTESNMAPLCDAIAKVL